MTTRTRTAQPQPGKRDKEKRQRSLIEAANAVFAEHGYDAATTREVAERAGCSEGLIHRYFSGKRGLLLAVMESKAAAVLDEFSSALPDRDNVEEDIEQALLWPLGVLWEHRDFMRVSVAQATIDPELGHSVAGRIHNQRVNLVLEKLRRHKEAGRMRPDVDLEAVAQAVAGFGFMLGFMGQVVIGMDREYAQRITVAFASLLTRGISAEPPGEPQEVTRPVPSARARSSRKGAPQ
jgi:AcrR family transcriptional regulator